MEISPASDEQTAHKVLITRHTIAEDCASELSGIASKLENIGKSGNLGTGNEALERLEKEFLRLEAFIENRQVIKKDKGASL